MSLKGFLKKTTRTISNYTDDSKKEERLEREIEELRRKKEQRDRIKSLEEEKKRLKGSTFNPEKVDKVKKILSSFAPSDNPEYRKKKQTSQPNPGLMFSEKPFADFSQMGKNNMSSKSDNAGLSRMFEYNNELLGIKKRRR